MKVLSITDDGNGYKEAILIANRVNRKNHFSAIEIDGEIMVSGGFIVEDTHYIREMLDKYDREDHYEIIKSIRVEPFVKSYLEET